MKSRIEPLYGWDMALKAAAAVVSGMAKRQIIDLMQTRRAVIDTIFDAPVALVPDERKDAARRCIDEYMRHVELIDLKALMLEKATYCKDENRLDITLIYTNCFSSIAFKVQW